MSTFVDLPVYSYRGLQVLVHYIRRILVLVLRSVECILRPFLRFFSRRTNFRRTFLLRRTFSPSNSIFSLPVLPVTYNPSNFSLDFPHYSPLFIRTRPRRINNQTWEIQVTSYVWRIPRILYDSAIVAPNSVFLRSLYIRRSLASISSLVCP